MRRSRWAVVVLLFATGLFVGCSSSSAATMGTATTGTSNTTGTTAAGNTGGTATTSATTAGSTTGTNPTQAPVIVSFVAAPPNLPAGGGQATLSWQVQNADVLSIDGGVGTVSGTSTTVSVTATTIFTLTATNANGKATASTAVSTGANPSRHGSRYVSMVSPTGGESFLAPATLRLIAAAHDPNVYTNSPRDGLGGNAAQVQFFVDDASVLTVDGSNAEYWIFKGTTPGVATGQHRVWARGIYTNPAEVLDSDPMIVTVADLPTYAQTIDLTADVTLGSTAYDLSGSVDKRIRLNGHGYRISSSSGASAALTLKFVDVFDLGNATDTSQRAIDVTTSGGLTIEDSTFDTSNTVSVSLAGTATASVRRNLFRSNMRMPIGQMPASYTPDGASYPVLHFAGSSTGAKVFAGNNVGAGWVELENAKNWTIGGDSDADSNVLIGPRVGIYTPGSSNMTVRRNYSHHVYFGGWSQGSNFEIEGTTASTIEHNVVYGSSWPVRGCSTGCQFQYNLVIDAGHEWMQPEPGASVHHNVFVGGESDVAGFYAYNDPPLSNAPTIDIHNNTIDAMKSATTAIKTESSTGPVALSSNAFLNCPMAPIVTVGSPMLTADYNGFFASPGMSYSDARAPAHDVSASGVGVAAAPSKEFDMNESTIWQRTTTAADVLGIYRAYYTPAAGSPLIDAGDPAGGVGNDIGAVGAGQANAADRFGLP